METNLKEKNFKILCRTCAAYGGCRLPKKGTTIKCKNFWEYIPTSDFEKYIK